MRDCARRRSRRVVQTRPVSPDNGVSGRRGRLVDDRRAVRERRVVRTDCRPQDAGPLAGRHSVMDTHDREQIERDTRTLYHGIHQQQLEDPAIFNRLVNLLSTEYLEVAPDFFHGKRCLDAGCGSNANAAFQMLRLGAAFVCAFDLDDTIFETVPRVLAPFQGRFELKASNVLAIDYPDQAFDFTHCAGVLMATPDIYRGL